MSAPTQPSGGNSSGSGRVRLGELLVQAGVLSAERLQEALKIQAAEGSKRRLGRLLVEQGFVDETLLTQLLGRQLSVPWVSLYHVDFSRQLLNLVPREVAEGYGLVPVYVRHVRGQGDTLYVATDDPTNEEGLRRAGAYAGLPVRPMIASASDIRSAIRAYYGGGKPEPVAAPAAVRVEQVEPVPAPQAAAKTLVEVPKPLPQKPTELPKPKPKSEAPKAPPAEAAKPKSEAPKPVEAEATKPKPAEAPVKRPGPSAAVVAALAAAATAPPKPPPPPDDDGPEIEATVIPPPQSRKGRAIALTFLDGTTIRLPAPRARKNIEPPKPEPQSAEHEQQLTAHDMIAALRALSQGAEATEVLGENPRWEAMFAALLSLVLKKHLIADWEFVEEFKKMTGKP